MDYSVSDLVKGLERARARGPKAEAAFRERIDAAFLRYKAGEPVELVFFDLLADDPEGRVNS